MDNNNPVVTLSHDLEGLAADGGEEQIQHVDGFDRDLADEACLEAAEEEVYMLEAAEDAAELEEPAAVMHFRMEHGPDDEIVDEEDEDGDEGEDDREEEEADTDEEDMNIDEGGNTVQESTMDEPTDELHVPIGVSPYLYAEETRILNGGSLLEDSDPVLFPAHLYGKGEIPSTIPKELKKLETKAIAKPGSGIYEGFPSEIFSVRLHLLKNKKTRDLQNAIAELTSEGGRFLYHGMKSWAYVLSILLGGMGPYLTVKNEFGKGVYLTDNLAYAQMYAGMFGGAILIFDWSDQKGLQEKYLTGSDWENTVKGWICLGDSTKPGPPSHSGDMLIGKISGNYQRIETCSKPIPSDIDQFVARTERAYSALNRSLVAIIYLE